MDELYKSLLSGVDTLTEQLKGHLFDMTELEGPVLMLVNDQDEICANHPSRVDFLVLSVPNSSHPFYYINVVDYHTKYNRSQLVW